MLPERFLTCLACFEPCFTSPSFQRFLTLMNGWVLCISKHTVTSVIRTANVVGKRDHSGYHRFFSTAAWCADEVGINLIRLLLTILPKNKRVMLTVDDTLARHTGKHISLAAMHHDPLLSTATKKFFHFGHVWVVVAVVVPFPKWDKVYSLPVLVRLYRSEKLNKKLGRPHQKKTQMADEMIQLVAKTFPERVFLMVGDNAYMNRSIIRPLPTQFDFIGRGRMDAALYDPPIIKVKKAGRQPVKGNKIASPQWRTAHCRWRNVEVNIHGRDCIVQVQVFEAQWYRTGHGRLLRFVLIRDWPGHNKDDVLVSTDLNMNAREIIEAYCCRWSLEETFGWAKGRLGLEEPQNRTEKAVQRTAPMALWIYSLVVYWYAGWSRKRSHLSFRTAPWNQSKRNPTFADMLATLRRESWTVWITDQADKNRFDQKYFDPLLDLVAHG